jgi:hypothetical protein
MNFFNDYTKEAVASGIILLLVTYHDTNHNHKLVQRFAKSTIV